MFRRFIIGEIRTPSYHLAGIRQSGYMMILLLMQKEECDMKCQNILKVSTLFISSIHILYALRALMMGMLSFITTAAIDRKVFFLDRSRMEVIRLKLRFVNS